jgi:hypothetical protein
MLFTVCTQCEHLLQRLEVLKDHLLSVEKFINAELDHRRGACQRCRHVIHSPEWVAPQLQLIASLGCAGVMSSSHW